MSATSTRAIRRTAAPASKQESAARSARSTRAPSAMAMRAGAGMPLSPTPQTKLEVNQPGDRFEREADHVADRVMRSAVPEHDGSCVECAQNPRGLQRTAAAPAEQTVQREGGGTPHVSAHTASTIRNPGAGSPLAPSVRGRVEPHLGASLAGVRVHTGPAAAQAASSLQARAFTYGNHIFLARNESSSDLRLMAHESTHVVQQGAAPVQRAPEEQVQRAAAVDEVQRCADCDGTVQRAPEEQVQRAADTPEIQRDVWSDISGVAGAAWDSTAGGIVDAAGNLVEMGADVFWALLEEVAPSVIPLVREIMDKGILQFLIDKISVAFDSIFSGLGGDGGVLEGFMSTIGTLASSYIEIVVALASGDCEPLFNAVTMLGDLLAELAGDAWNAIVEFLQPVGDFFSELWQSFGAPVVDWLTQMAGDVWQGIQDIGTQLWDLTQPVRDALSAAWDWLKDQLGIGEGAEGQSGLLQWIQDKAAEAWDWIKAQLEPVIGPIQGLVESITAILPLDAIFNLRDTVAEWLGNAGSMAQAMQQPEGVVESQDTLRNEILPAVLSAIVGLQGSLISAGIWIAGQVAGLTATVTGMVDSLRSNPILGAAAGAVDWVVTAVNSLSLWVQSTVVSLFTGLGEGLVRLSAFIEPVLGVLQKLIDVLADVVGELPALVLGPVWLIIPRCLRDPITNFIIEHILSHIPIINKFLTIPDIWSKIQGLVLSFLRKVFIDGDLSGAAMAVIRFVLEAIGIDVNLFLSILANAASAIETIIMDPVAFLSNIFGALSKGLGQFVSNIGQHLITGLLGWLLGPLKDLGVTPPTELSLESVLTLVLQILGISAAKLRQKAEKLVGPKAVRLFEEAWRWISALLSGGLGGLWAELQSQLSDLWSTIIGGISEWITVELVEVGVQKLVTMSNPVGMVIEAILAIYNTVTFFVERINQILEFANAVVSSIGQIAAGAIDAAANWIEQALASTIPTILGFLATLVGIDDPAPTIRKIVLGIQAKVDKALDWLVDKALAIGRKILSGLGLGGGKDDKGTGEAEHERIATAALDKIDAVEGGATTAETIAAKRKVADAEISAASGTIAAGTRFTITLLNESTAEEDGELRWKARIAPNTTEKTRDDALPAAEQDLQAARSHFGERAFARKELVALLAHRSSRTVDSRIQNWKDDDILFEYASKPKDPNKKLSFSATVAGLRPVTPGNRFKYGYVNPDKRDKKGLAILSIGLIKDPAYGYSPGKENDLTYHLTQARYKCVRTGQIIDFENAVLGHKDPGASGHWNLEGHKQTRQENFDWNQLVSNYQGPEEKYASKASGGKAERYDPPSEERGSHEMWWKADHPDFAG